jgi:Uma2 family endonuclease
MYASYTETMSVTLLREPPLVPPSDLGPYRRQDYESLPDEPRCELLFGRFYVSPSPSVLHQVVSLLLWKALDEIAQATGGRAWAAPLDVTLADHSIVQPDVIYATPERKGIARDRIEGAPDLLVEILSPGTARRDRGEKLILYAQSGIREYWIVDPIERDIEFLINESGRFAVVPPTTDEYQSSVVSGVRLDLLEFWRQVDARLS